MPTVERPPGLALTGANLLSHKLDMMDKLLKAVAASASQAQVTAKQEPEEPQSLLEQKWVNVRHKKSVQIQLKKLE